MSGFVYIWFDRKHKRYYIGCHWGSEDDGYVCSSVWMKRSYKRRPKDFKRKILARDANRQSLLEQEHKWLTLIKPEELGTRYYNLHNKKFNHWTALPDEERVRSIGEKISKARKGKPCPKNSRPCSDEKKQFLSEMWTGVPKGFRGTDETRRKISANNKRLQAEGRIGTKGRKFPDRVEKMSGDKNPMANPIHRDKVKASKQGIKCLMLNGKKKMAVPGTDYWNELILLGAEMSEPTSYAGRRRKLKREQGTSL